jgi:phospholipid/cholesterol/gamma-HCH transport system ATP-binding protein
MKKQPKIIIENLCKSFGNNSVLKGINLTINQGESLAVIGGSGSGKSVLIKTAIGLFKPTSGSIVIDGIRVDQFNEKQRNQLMNKLGFLFQGGALFDSLPVWHNVAFGLIEYQRMAKRDAMEIAQQKLKEVGLEPRVMNLFPSELSGGMQKRVALARAIAAKPEIIFFDEPTSGLDPIMSNVINELIVANSKALGATTITITHDMNSVRKIADRVAMIYQGAIVWCGAVAEMETCGNKFVAQFIKGQTVGPIVV